MKIYLAGQFESRKRLRPHASALWDLGHEVVSTWLNEVQQMKEMSHDEFFRKLAMKDIAEIQSCDLLIQDTFKMSLRGGASTEYGLALHGFQNKLVWVVGPKRSVFHHLADKQFKTWKECINALRA
jgi:nucleoside 2-deoxyribosyltransferase